MHNLVKKIEIMTLGSIALALAPPYEMKIQNADAAHRHNKGQSIDYSSAMQKFDAQKQIL